jgi:hypothetical protein
MRSAVMLLTAVAGFGLAAPPASPLGEGVIADIRCGDALVSKLHGGADGDKPYLWPLLAPGEVPVTRAWPMDKAGAKSTDHVHQKSAWFCHGDVIPEGIPLAAKVKGVEGVDLWAEGAGHGWIVPWNVGKGEGTIDLGCLWQTSDHKTFMREERHISWRDLGDARLLVFDILLHADVCPITFGDTKEGSFGVRVNDQIAVKTGQGTISNADGKTGEKACWGYPSKWCDYSGTVDGKAVGITVFDDPANPYPACWHVRDYGLMAANPFGRNGSGFPAMKGRTDLVKMAKGDHLPLRYGILLHTGDAKTGRVAEHFETFVAMGKKVPGV